ncbi:MAG: LuxR C-terminal-related transcriptional regulator [Anaerolineales bacterium]|jgi:LuxR family maltose regulon positive regulatory protein
MAVPLVVTKTKIPPFRDNRVLRPQLQLRLTEGLKRNLTLISCPAGFGKTTLLSEFAAKCERRVAWFSIDSEDDDSHRFMSYFIASLDTIHEGLATALYPLLETPRPAPLETLLAKMINEINAEFPPFVAILDDYQLIFSHEIHRAMTYLVEHQPAQMHLMISTRADPPLPLSRLRGRDQLTEIREKDLRFRIDEADMFLNQVMKLNLDRQQVEALEGRTEGWAAGLQLAAISLQEQPNKERFIEDFAGSNRFILDYLGQEVLDKQEEQVRKFLLQTSILERMTALLCETVTLLPNCREILEHLEENHLFIQALDQDHTWYKYHRLFKEFLLKTLNNEVPGMAAELHQRASTWYENQGLKDEAIDHALAAGDQNRASKLIESIAIEKLRRSETSSLIRWIEALSADLVDRNPALCITQAWALMLRGGPLDQVEARLRMIEDRSVPDQYLGSACAVRALMASIDGRPEESRRFSQQSLALIREDDLFTRSLIADNLGMVYLMKGDFSSAVDNFSRAVEIGQREGNLMITVGGLCNMAGIWMLQGQLRRAWEANEKALELATDQHGRRLPIAGKALLGLGEIAREWNDLAGAQAYLEEGLQLFQIYGELGSIISYVSLARIKEIQADFAAAQEIIDLAGDLAHKFQASQMDDELVESYQAQLWLRMGELQRAENWVTEKQLASLVSSRGASERFDPVWEIHTQTLTRVYMSRGDYLSAMQATIPLLQTVNKNHRLRSVIRVLALQAVLHQFLGEKEKAIDTLNQALDLGEEESFIRTFLDEGEPMAHLLYEAAEKGHHTGYIGKLLAEYSSEAKRIEAGRLGNDQTGLVEPLSSREIEVLELIADGKSNREIAGLLHISLSTVKGHTSNIYGKLNVRSRVQSVARARELGIIT